MKIVRKQVVAILKKVADRNDQSPVEFGNGSASDEVRLVAELIDDGYLDGSHMEDEMGRPCHATVTGISIAGHDHIDQLRNEGFRASKKGKALAMAKYIAVFALGIIATVVSQWLAKKLGVD
ncbi:MAG: hypothetical protein HN849_03310 [Victivallales bacterium]|jgi:hypothetical protein|nr:hypothetical protein [Victivallales bacterium]